MSVYKHHQGNYQSYRVARSVDGRLCQEYFPRTRQGYSDAKKRDAELTRDQERAQQFFTGPALRWQKKPKKVERTRSNRSKTAAPMRATRLAKSGPKKSVVKTTARTTLKAAPKRATLAKRSTPRAVARTSKRKAIA